MSQQNGPPTPEQLAELNKKIPFPEPKDYKQPKLTKNERIMYEMALRLDKLERTMTGVHRMLTSLIAVSQPDMEELIKTMRNDMRIGSVLADITKTEQQIIAEETAKGLELLKSN